MKRYFSSLLKHTGISFGHGAQAAPESGTRFADRHTDAPILESIEEKVAEASASPVSPTATTPVMSASENSKENVISSSAVMQPESKASPSGERTNSPNVEVSGSPAVKKSPKSRDVAILEKSAAVAHETQDHAAIPTGKKEELYKPALMAPTSIVQEIPGRSMGVIEHDAPASSGHPTTHTEAIASIESVERPLETVEQSSRPEHRQMNDDQPLEMKTQAVKAATPGLMSDTRTDTVYLKEVMEWVSEGRQEDRKAVQVAEESDHGVARRSDIRTGTPIAEKEPASGFSLSIGTISLVVEGTAEKAVAEPRVATRENTNIKKLDQETGVSRLSRHYVRVR